jgi:hypothetical protein
VQSKDSAGKRLDRAGGRMIADQVRLVIPPTEEDSHQRQQPRSAWRPSAAPVATLMGTPTRDRTYFALIEVAHGGRPEQEWDMPCIDDLSDAEFMKLQAEYGDNLPICPICTLEDVRHLLLGLVADDAVSDEVKNAIAPVLYAVAGALLTDRTMAEQGEGSAHLGGDEDDDDGGAPTRPQ